MDGKLKTRKHKSDSHLRKTMTCSCISTEAFGVMLLHNEGERYSEEVIDWNFDAATFDMFTEVQCYKFDKPEIPPCQISCKNTYACTNL